MHVHASNVSAWHSSLFGTPIHGSAPLAGRSRITDMFAGLFDFFPTSWACTHAVCMPGQLSSPSVLSRHGFVPLIGKSCSFMPSVHVLMRLCVSPAIFMCIAMPWVSTHMFGMPVWLLDSTSSCLPASTGKLRGILMCIDGFFCVCSRIHAVSSVWHIPVPARC